MPRLFEETAPGLAWITALTASLAVLFIGGVLGHTPAFFVDGKPVVPFGEAGLRTLVAVEVASVQI